MKSSLSIWRYVVNAGWVNVKSMVKILSIFVAFLENTNFNLTTSMMSTVEQFDGKNI